MNHRRFEKQISKRQQKKNTYISTHSKGNQRTEVKNRRKQNKTQQGKGTQTQKCNKMTREMMKPNLRTLEQNF